MFPQLLAAAPLVMSLFGGGKKQKGPEKSFLELVSLLNQYFAPYMADVTRAGALQGQGLAQGVVMGAYI